MERNSRFDLVVVGAGPGGYVAAIRAAQLGMTVAIVDKSKSLGGTCLNIGCIPSKALLASTEHLHFVMREAGEHGIMAGDVRYDLGRMMKRKRDTVSRLARGIGGLMKKHGIEVYHGTASISAPGEVGIDSADGEPVQLRARRILISTGSSPSELPGVAIDGRGVVTSTGALEFEEVPGRLVVAGAGAIGLELGSVWARLGSEVHVVEFLPGIASGFDADIQRGLQRELEALGIQFHLSTKVTGVGYADGRPQLSAESESAGTVEFDADKVLVAIGRRPNTDGLFGDGFTLEMDRRGRIEIDGQFRTSAEGVYAIGDVVAGPMLAHKAEEEGAACVEGMLGMPTGIDHSMVPNVIYTAPEAAAVGLTESEAREQGREISVGNFPYQANGRALANGDTTGFVKIVADAGSGRILGAHILSPAASELLAEIVVCMSYHGCTEDLARTLHAHPTLSEAAKEAALAAEGRVIHM